MVIPSINCPDFAGAKEHIRKAEDFLPDGGWIHIDVEDGRFTPHATWGNPEELLSLKTELNVEVHLMVEKPEGVLESWLKAGAKRIIVHLQAVRDADFILETCRTYGAEAVLSFDPTVSVEDGEELLEKFDYFQVLTVFPGPSGQKEKPGWAEKIKALRAKKPTATIEVDGGMDPEDGRLAKDAGADVLVSGHYIFSSTSPEEAYKTLDRIT